jgi:TPR repeat protein
MRLFPAALLLAALTLPVLAPAAVAQQSGGATPDVKPTPASPAPASSAPAAPATGSPPPDLAFGAYQNGNYLTAMQEALKRVKANPDDAPAMTLLGEIYREGYAVKRNLPEAARWYRLAADRGDRQAQFALGLAYLAGSGVQQSAKNARVWFEKAAAQRHAGALYNLGVLELETDIRDFREVARYFQQAADLGDVDAAYGLAVLYREGTGVPADKAKAALYLRKAAEEKHLAAMVEYAIALFNGDGVAKDEAGAAKFFARAASLNSAVAQNRLARLYVAGRGVKADLVQAMQWHVLARANGVKDEWLDGKMSTLSQSEKAAVDEAVQRFLGR